LPAPASAELSLPDLRRNRIDVTRRGIHFRCKSISHTIMQPVLVTAFGPFDGRHENASSLALDLLKGIVPEIRTRVLPVDSVLAPARLKRALAQIRPRALVMLGEAAGSHTIRLESTAWNEMDFRIPDLAGRQPRSRPIRREGAAHLKSTLPLTLLEDRLRQTSHDVAISDDPGRYLCNQVFFIARDWIDRHGANCQAGFVHLPLATDYPTERAVRALVSVLDVL
jgi:pyroglutamyl-peptidase